MYRDSSIHPCGHTGPGSTRCCPEPEPARGLCARGPAPVPAVPGRGRGSARAARPPRAGARCPPGAAPRDTRSPDPRPPGPPLPPRTHTGHPSVLRAVHSGGAGLAARPPGPGSAASSGAERGGMGRAEPPGRGPAERVTNKENGDWSGGGPAPRAAASGGRGEAQQGLAAMEAWSCLSLHSPELGPASIP